MAKFNKAQTIKTVNKEGHAAYSMPDKQRLVAQVLTSFFNEAKFYGDNSDEMQDTIKAVIKGDPQFVANLAVYARREFHMRSVSHVLTAYLAHEVEGKPFVRDVVKAVVQRGDDATEIMACYLNLFGKPIPNSLRKGLRDVLTGFDAYTLAKYKGEGKAVKMRDLLCLCRPSPQSEEQSAAWKALLEGTLEPPYTWEVELSKNGNNAETWEKLIASGKVGYMALLRNLRNIINADPANVGKVLDTIRDPERVRKSKQLPFRFLSAYKELKQIGSSKVFDALEEALEASIENIPRIPGRTVIAVDVSGSMGTNISSKSKVMCSEIALLLGLIANRICEDSIFYVFDSRIRRYPLSRRTNLLREASQRVGGGATHMNLPFEEMLYNQISADRIIILSDNQCNGYGYNRGAAIQSYADQCRQHIGNDFWVHAIDLQGYGTQQFTGPKTNIIAGWSEKVFDFILLAEQGMGSLEKTIAEYKW